MRVGRSSRCRRPHQIGEILKIVEDDWESVVNDNGLRIWKKDGRLISHLEGDSICVGSARDEESFALLLELGFARQ